MRFVVIYEKSATGYGAYVPDLPGLGVVGTTLEETRELMREGIDLHLQSLREHGEAIPHPSRSSEEIDVPLTA
jgi:predicted RNase H-like HicB family nuclease